eukprot:scaffold53_cov193-Pinguiococcus_pyrenoidosus.AAC.15
MHPVDVPEGTFRARFIRLCCSLDMNVKSTAVEILYEICNRDENVLVDRIGFGNAVAFLRMKGLVNVAGL